MRFFLLLVTAAAYAQTSSVFDPNALDRTADPCVDFYRYACGGWMKANPIPPDQTRWGRFSLLFEQNLATLRAILETASAPGSKDAKIGDAYATCMDEPAIKDRGAEPLKPLLEKIAAISNRNQITEAVIALHVAGVRVLFGFESRQDLKDPKLQIGSLNPAALGLPDRTIYFGTDPRSDALRRAYRSHVASMLQFAGLPDPEATAERAIRFESTIARAMMDRVAQREPRNSYHVYTVAELVSLSPGFLWQDYFAKAGAPALASMAATLNVSHPPYFREIESQIVQSSLDDWKAYLSWHLIRSTWPRLPDPFFAEGFRFYGTQLQGQKDKGPRWKRCVNDINQSLSDLLGRKYAEAAFGEDGKRRVTSLVADLRAALSRDIESLPWMSAETKKEAQAKLAAVSQKIGYPEKWDDYAKVEVRRGDYFGNGLRLAAYARQKSIDRIGKPVDRAEWQLPVPTVDAFYNGANNEIIFPAGILQPPFFDKNADDAVNYGAIGTVIGHEFTHGFDDQGRKFDAAGALRDWWTPSDAAEYEKRSQCFIDEYANFESAGLRLNGKLTLGENTADNGGVRIALMALVASLAKSGKADKIDGFTPQQRFFLAFGQTWCGNVTEEVAKLLVATDPHSPGSARANGTVVNMPEFAQAFACRLDQPMTRGPACRVW